MKKIPVVLFIFSLPIVGYSQSVLGKFKDKVKSRLEQRADEGMDKAIDKTEEKIKEDKKQEKEQGKQPEEKKVAANSGASTSFQSYSHYDFIPGEEILYVEDFSQDVVGEFPLKWSTNNHGQTVAIKGQEGKWMRIFKEGHFVSPYLKALPDNFTTEFDMVLHLPENVDNTSYPELKIRLMNVPAGDEKARQFFKNYFDSKADTRVTLKPYTDEHSTIGLVSTLGGNNQDYFTSEDKELPKLKNYLDKPMHVAIWVQTERFRMWINGEKVYDLPQAVPAKAAFNRMELETSGSSYADEAIGYYIGNLRFAQGAPDLRSKLITEGKLVTTGILFDVNSDRIKPESSGVLQEIAKVLKENRSVKVKIIGHTDSDGEDAKNLQLSKARAASVKQALTSQFGVEASRMETDGRGEAQPVADNNSKEGKAKNRRVEFIKQ